MPRTPDPTVGLQAALARTGGGEAGLRDAVRELLAETWFEHLPGGELSAFEDRLIGAVQRVRGRGRRDPYGWVPTPSPVASSLRVLMAAAYPDAATSCELVLDPCAGSGRLLAPFPTPAAGWDVDPVALAIGAAMQGARARLGLPASWSLAELDGLATPRPDVPPGRLMVVCNPPYVATYARGSYAAEVDGRRIRAVTGAWGSGRQNLAVTFVARVIRDLLRPGEVAGFIVPDALLNAPSYAPLRRAWLEHVEDLVVARLDDGSFPGRSVRSVLVACRRRERIALDDPGAEGAIRFAEVTGDGVRWVRSLPSRTVSRLPMQVIPWPTPATDLALRLVQAGVPTLGEAVELADGANPGGRDARAALIRPTRAGMRSPRPLIEGRDIDAGYLHPPRSFIESDPDAVRPEWRAAGTSLRRRGLFVGPRLYSRQTARRLTVAFTEGPSVASNSVHVIRSRRGGGDARRELRRLCAVLNTPTVTALYLALFSEDRTTFPQVKLAQLRMLPLPWPLQDSDPVAAAVAAAADAWCDEPSVERLRDVDAAVVMWLKARAAAR